ncbi:MAG: carbamoyl-phosphate synthase large subunit [Firmicutes bacterium]|nr:carbamoyl-phosphate synthase large subunit [Bacillota bacterium]
MPVLPEVSKVLVIGSGPIIIGQAAEFDYAGSQACRALREIGVRVVLVNSNPATIMTDLAVADVVYIEPLNVESIERIICKERPGGLLPTLGGQTGLNLAVELHDSGILDRYGVRLLGTPIEAIRKAEDRVLFREAMRAAGQPVIESEPVTSVSGALEFARSHTLPVVVRPAFTLGGSGGGIAFNEHDLAEIASRGLALSPVKQLLLERTVLGWKEIEYEVVRDGAGNCITVCNMENVDPMGVHTGDSIVVAPSQTLSDEDYQMLRDAALAIIGHLRIEGGCNVQFALDPRGSRYYVIEVNPRLSRSSALASKATGYPIAKVAAKIAAGLRLDEVVNPITGSTSALFEPALDYVVLKIPRWPFDKFPLADCSLGTQMKATGEAMAIDRSFEAALMKAIRSLDLKSDAIRQPQYSGLGLDQIVAGLRVPTHERLFLVAEAIARGMGIAEISELSGIDPFFVRKTERLVRIEQGLGSLGKALTGSAAGGDDRANVPRSMLDVKRAGFSDRRIAGAAGLRDGQVTTMRLGASAGAAGIAGLPLLPAYKMVDTCAGEFEARTPYYYSTYGAEDEAPRMGDATVMIIGSGPIKIGQGIEFDYCCVHAAIALRKMGYRTVMVNNNPETVSTDFDISDRLYFEPVTFEDVMNIVVKERPLGVFVQFGGQTAINLAGPLSAAGAPIAGTQAGSIDAAEDRGKFDALLASLGIPRPQGGVAFSVVQGREVASSAGYPVLVRPSFVIAGRAMEIVRNESELTTYLASAVQVTPEHPVLIDRYIEGREVEVDAVCDGTETLVCGIMEHVEQAGIHSGDSIAVYPPVSLDATQREAIVDYTSRISAALGVKGLINVQFVIDGARVMVIEANPRASRTVPFLSKAAGLPIVDIAVAVSLGATLRGLGYTPGIYREPARCAVKAPVFSFGKLVGVESSLGPEMKSTGEVMGMAPTLPEAMHGALSAAGYSVRSGGTVLLSIADRDKSAAEDVARGFRSLGFHLAATDHTAEWLQRSGIPVRRLDKANGAGIMESPALRRVSQGEVDLAVVTASVGKDPSRWGFRLRRTLAEHGVPTITSLATARAFLMATRWRIDTETGGHSPAGPVSLNEYLCMD